MYVSPNYKTKKELKEAVKAGRTVEVFSPGPFQVDLDRRQEVSVEGPHYPEPHRWYARVVIEHGVVLEVRG